MQDKIKLRDRLKFKADIKEFTEYIGCSDKGIYHIENNLLKNKSVRYIMYLKKQGFDINKIIDLLLELEKKAEKKESK